MLHKVVSSLPANLSPSSIYLVRVGAGFDMYVTDNTATPSAKKINQAGNTYDLSSNDINSTHTFNAWHRSNDDTWHAVRYALATGQKDGTATGSGSIPADLKTLTYA